MSVLFFFLLSFLVLILSTPIVTTKPLKTTYIKLPHALNKSILLVYILNANLGTVTSQASLVIINVYTLLIYPKNDCTSFTSNIQNRLLLPGPLPFHLGWYHDHLGLYQTSGRTRLSILLSSELNATNLYK